MITCNHLLVVNIGVTWYTFPLSSPKPTKKKSINKNYPKKFPITFLKKDFLYFRTDADQA